MRDYTLSYCILSCSVWLLSTEGLLFLRRKQRDRGPREEWRWEGLGGVEGGKYVFGMYSMEEKYILNKNAAFSKQCIWYTLIKFQLYSKEYVTIKCNLAFHILRNTKAEWNVPWVLVRNSAF